MKDLRHLRSPLFIYFSLLFGHEINRGQFIAAKDSSGVSSRNRQKKAAFVGSIWRTLWIGTGFARHSDGIALQMRTPKDAAPGCGNSLCLPCTSCWFIVSVCICLRSCSCPFSCPCSCHVLPVSPWYVFFEFRFLVFQCWIWTLIFSLYFALFYFATWCCCFFVTGPVSWS